MHSIEAPTAIQAAVGNGAKAASALEDLVRQLKAPRAVWVMLPAGDPTENTVRALAELLSKGDTIIDGGNSNYKESMRRAGMVAERGLHFVDVGTSGGIWGLTEGYSLMVGGPNDAVDRCRPIFETLAPAKDQGWGHVGPAGSGHFTKMVHNGIEYGMMQAYAEGFSILKHKKEFSLDLAQIAELWRTGSVVRSWLLDLTARALHDDQDLDVDRAVRVRLGRRPVDGGRGDRPRRSGAGDHAVAVAAAPLARFGVVHGPTAVGVAESVRRPRGEEELRERSGTWNGLVRRAERTGQGFPWPRRRDDRAG